MVYGLNSFARGLWQINESKRGKTLYFGTLTLRGRGARHERLHKPSKPRGNGGARDGIHLTRLLAAADRFLDFLGMDRGEILHVITVDHSCI